jgi:hypothetical protein
MMRYENLETCPFYQRKMSINYAAGSLYRRIYCEQDKTKCARYKVSSKLEKDKVPIDLYPNMQDRADKIFSEHT